jgi:hypothetical protein
MKQFIEWVISFFRERRGVVRIGRDYLAEVYQDEPEMVFDEDDKYTEKDEQ